MDFQAWLLAVQSALAASNHPMPASAYSTSHLSNLFQQGVSPVLAARQVVAGQIPMALPPTPAAPIGPVATSLAERSLLDLARRFCIVGGWVISTIGAVYVVGGLILVLVGMATRDALAAGFGLFVAFAPMTAGLVVMACGGVLLVFGYGSKLLLDIHERMTAQ